jgi:hypothetical protein
MFGPVFNDGAGTSEVYLNLLRDGYVTFPDGIWHSNEFSLVSTRWCQTSHQQCWTSLSSWRFRGESAIESVLCTISGKFFMATNLTGLQ